MKYRYQLILLGENVKLFEQLKLELTKKFDELKLIQVELLTLLGQKVKHKKLTFVKV